MGNFEKGGRGDLPHKPAVDTRYIPPVGERPDYHLPLQSSMDNFSQDKKPQRSRLPETGLVEPVHPTYISLSKNSEGKLREEKEKAGDEVQDSIKKTEQVEKKTTLEQRHPDWPQEINVTLYFSYHVLSQDTEGIQEHMAGKDIWFGEGGCQKADVLDGFRTIATPDGYTTDEFQEGMRTSTYDGLPFVESFYGPLLNVLYQSGIVVGNADLRESERELDNQIRETHNRSYIEKDFDTTLVNLKKRTTDDAQFQNKREQIITARFEEELGQILEEHPELKEKDTLEIIKTMGINHRGSLDDKFVENGVTTTAIVNGYESANYKQVYSDLREGKEPEKESLARLHLTSFILETTLPVSNSTSASFEYTQRVLPYFTTRDVEEVHKRYIEEGNFDKLTMLLTLKDLPPLPKSNDELAVALEQLRKDTRDPSQRDYYHLP